MPTSCSPPCGTRWRLTPTWTTSTCTAGRRPAARSSPSPPGLGRRPPASERTRAPRCRPAPASPCFVISPPRPGCSSAQPLRPPWPPARPRSFRRPPECGRLGSRRRDAGMLLVTLLGRRNLLADGVEVPGPRGHKAWALLAHLVGNGAPVPRERLVPLLFPDAVDGRAALRWNLGQLRRVLGEPGCCTGDPVVLGLGPAVRVDVQLLAAAPWYEVVDRIDVGGVLLEGLTFPTCPGFELCLEGERRRMVELGSAALREAARAETAN